MAEKRYDWLDGATLEEHSRRKHKILREYFISLPRRSLPWPHNAVPPGCRGMGFAGGGRYKCGTPGSPIIFVEASEGLHAVNLQRISAGSGSSRSNAFLS